MKIIFYKCSWSALTVFTYTHTIYSLYSFICVLEITHHQTHPPLSPTYYIPIVTNNKKLILNLILQHVMCLKCILSNKIKYILSSADIQMCKDILIYICTHSFPASTKLLKRRILPILPYPEVQGQSMICYIFTFTGNTIQDSNTVNTSK